MALTSPPNPRKGGGSKPSPTHTVLLWMGTLIAICAVIALLVALGMSVAAAVVTVPTLTLAATQVITQLNQNKDGTAEDADTGTPAGPATPAAAGVPATSPTAVLPSPSVEPEQHRASELEAPVVLETAATGHEAGEHDAAA
ncbi:hypothetical protein Kpho02_72800 [Kitasatospora phosalacinea]|uniref:Uncharacterized protein n=1 Tax=Kitasatospora phosalacinea TaxID=2065 RepID=A0A9W6QHD9_9ACTN|nr:hypothetical protein [Kitasatospora phosalacinea]GLW74983.1 hypothetical protein Kpho02_72800 [Kitasatospora phosalacinea]